MTLEIRSPIKPINLMDRYAAATFELDREVYINGKRALPNLEQAILNVLDWATVEYIAEISKKDI